MTKSYETGNAKNVANFQKLIEQITVYQKYNPPVENLKLESLNNLYTAALASLTTLEDKRNANKNAIHLRQQQFENLRSISTRILNHIEILGVPAGTLEQAKSLNRLLHGVSKRKITATEEGEQEQKTASTSRQSYTQLADNFSKLLQLITSITNYAPNTEDLKIESLNTYSTNLVNSTKEVDKTAAEFNTKLIERNNILYAEGTGLYSIAQNIKKYVKSVYGSNAQEYAKVAKIKFTSKQI